MREDTATTIDNIGIEIKKDTFSRDWSLYNLSQTREKMAFLRILDRAVDSMDIPYDYKGTGRPPIPKSDMLKCCVIKAFNCFSSRRTIAELQLAHALGYINEVYHFNTISKYMRDPELSPYLHQLYKTLALPMVDIESTFAIDATGFSMPHRDRWVKVRFDKQYTKMRYWKKLHAICGVRTQAITSCKVTEGTKSDMNEFEPLVKQTAKRFRMREICADAGYLSRKNCGIASSVGAVPYIMPRKGVTPRPMTYPSWRQMIRLWKENEQAFRDHYHKRSVVESAFSALKRKFSGSLRSKDDTGQVNEILCKVVCHNAAVLVSSIFALGVDEHLAYKSG